MPLVSVTISTETPGLTRRGFGRHLIATNHAYFPELARLYSNPGDMLADGFTTGHLAYLAAQAIMAQTPAPKDFKIGRLSTNLTHVETFTPSVSGGAGVTYSVEITTIDGVTVVYEYTADATPTAIEICDALITAIQAGAQAAKLTATGTGTGVLTITADVAGEHLSMRAYDDGSGHLWTRLNTTTQSAVAAELAAIKTYDDDWYGLVLAVPISDAVITAAAPWAQTNKKLMGFTTGDGVAKTAAGGGGDVLDDQDVASRNYVHGWYSDRPHQFVDAAATGRIFPLEPGAATAAVKTLANVEAVPLRVSDKATIESKNGNWYGTEHGVGITFPGKVGNGDYIDTTRSIDWLVARLQEEIFLAVRNANKIPFTDKGAAVIEGKIRSVWDEGVKNGAFNDDLVVTVPAIADLPAAAKTARTLPGITFRGTLQGAIHTVEISGTVAA